jgi:flagellar L-ring protein FlgH
MKLYLLMLLSVVAYGQSPGSLYRAGNRYGSLTSDFRAADVGDLVTVVVNDTANAVATGASNTARKSAYSSGITGLGGVTDPRFSNLLAMNGNNTLQAQGTTSRNTTLTATITARVVQVTPSGNLVIEGIKDIGVNSEHQSVLLKGIIRPVDLTVTNTITSNQVANLDIKVNGKGIVGDSIRRPNFLYRLLAGLLPF